MNQRITFGNSYLESISGIDHLNLREKNHYETGFAAGNLFIESNNKMIRLFKNPFAKIVLWCLYLKHKNKIHDIRVPKEYQDELKGYAEATKIPYKYLLLLNLIYEVKGCSGFAFFNPDKSLLVGHNTDAFKLLGKFLLNKTNPLVVSISVPGKNFFTHISLPGFIGVANGFNNRGIAISAHDAGNIYHKTVVGNTSTSCVLRMLLEKSDSLENISKIAHNNPPYLPGIVLVASERERGFGILEVYPTKINFVRKPENNYAFSANHYHSSEMKEHHKSIESGSIKRYDYLEGYFLNREGLTIGEAIDILKNTDHGIKWDKTGGQRSVANEGTFQSFVFDVTKDEVYISNGKKLPVSLHGNFVKIPIKL